MADAVYKDIGVVGRNHITMNSAAYHITLSHPETELPDYKFVERYRFTNLWADKIMELHVRHTDILDKFTEEEHGKSYGHYIELLFVPDLYTLSAPGFQMADFWMDFQVDCVMNWDRWYVQVNRCPIKGWQLHILVASKNGTDVDADHFTADMWQAYKNYFSRYSPPEQSLQFTAYDGQAFEDHKAQLIRSAQGNFHDLVEDMSRVSALGSVYRTLSQYGECMLWCDTNDPHYKCCTSRLWRAAATEVAAST